MKAFWPQSLAGRLIFWLMLVLALALVLMLFLHRISNERMLARIAEEDALTRITMVSRILEQSGKNNWQNTLHAATTDDFRFSFFDKKNNENQIIIEQLSEHKSAANSFSRGNSRKPNDMADDYSIQLAKDGRLTKVQRDGKIWVINPLDNRQEPPAPFLPPKFKDKAKNTITVRIDDRQIHNPERLQKEHSRRLERIVFPQGNPQADRHLAKFIQNAYRRAQEKGTIDLALQLDNGRWLKGAFKPRTPPIWSLNGALFLGLLALSVGGVIVLVVRTETRPMQHLAEAAEALGRGEHLPPLDEEGPQEVRTAVKAFNLMGSRLGSFMQDRTRMLAAMSHDLRTPLTTLRLRAEMIDEPETREKLIETIEEMHRITEASLSFAREEDYHEETRKTDLISLLSDLCEEACAMGNDVTLAADIPELTARVRPGAIRRALRNLIDNAVRYGKCARLSLHKDADNIYIITEDDGPGMDESSFEEVFAPFVRLESSRNADTGGAGLGLAIARTIARSHGGDITLHNGKTGGLRAVFHVPDITS